MQKHSSPRMVGAQRQNVEKKCVSHSNPSSLLFIGAEQLHENSLGTRESIVGPITEHHMEADGETWQGWFDWSKGSADLGPPRLLLCFLPVTDMWSLMTILGARMVWRRFAQVVGPWILVPNTWRRLIHRGVLLLDWWGVMDTWHPVCQHVATWPGVGPTGSTWYLVHIPLIRPLIEGFRLES
jgi:hypothetical protein